MARAQSNTRHDADETDSTRQAQAALLIGPCGGGADNTVCAPHARLGMLNFNDSGRTTKARSDVQLVPVAATVRPLNKRLWSLLTRPGPLTAEEWAYIEAEERAG